jgi:Uma2 family endonuclease
LRCGYDCGPTDRRIELIDSLIVEMSPEGTEHTYFEENLAKLLAQLLKDQAYVRENKSITLASSEPEPDIAVVSLTRSQCLQHIPSQRIFY